MFRRRRFSDLIERQLDLFERDHGDVIEEAADKLDAYDHAERDGATQLYGDYVDVVEEGTEILADIRDAYAATLPESVDEVYGREFNRAVARRWPAFAIEIENR
jgi:hypothetical protein